MKLYTAICKNLFLICFLFPNWNIFASKARLEALGGQDVVSNYLNDTRNILINPAYLNINKDFIVFEWGEDYSGPEEKQQRPKSEGGFFKSFGLFNYGLYLGHEEDKGRSEFNNPNFLLKDNAFELFIAGEAGMAWGASLIFSNNKDEQTNVSREQTSLGVKFGVLSGPIETYLNIDLFDKSDGGATSLEGYKGGLTFNFGGNYVQQNVIFHAKIMKSGYEYKTADDGSVERDHSDITGIVGIGRRFLVNENAKMLFDLSFLKTSTVKNSFIPEDKFQEKTNLWKLPVTFGLESDVKDWLTVRAHIKQNLFSNEENTSGKSKTINSSTSVAAGATLTFDKLKIDGLIGTLDAKGENASQGILDLSHLLTQVSMSYLF